MSLKELHSRIEAILDEPNPLVLALKGGWGEGKTYFWKNFVTTGRHAPRIGYVSLFGLESIADLRTRVLLTSPRLIALASDGVGGQQATWRKALTLGGELGKFLLTWFKVPSELLAAMIEKQCVGPGMILCFDDLERSTLHSEALLGYIGELRDERGISVVLIYNEDAIATNGALSEALRKYQEKVIDREIRFVGKFNEIVPAVFADCLRVGGNTKLINLLTEKCAVLQLRNIRLLVRTKNCLRDVLADLPSEVEDEFLEAVVSSVLLFVYAKFSALKLEGGLTLQFLGAYNSVAFRLLRADEKRGSKSEEQQRIHELLERYGYVFTDDVDRALLDFLGENRFEAGAFGRIYESWVANRDKRRKQGKFAEVWQTLFHGSLDDNGKELGDAFLAAARDHLGGITGPDLDDVLMILGRLGRGAEAEKLLDDFVNLRPEAIRTLRDNAAIYPVRYPRLVAIRDAGRIEDDLERRTVSDVIEDLDAGRGLSSADRERMNSVSVEEILNALTNGSLDRVTFKVRALVRLGFEMQSGTDEAGLGRTMRKVVLAIASQSEVNRIRIETVGLGALLAGNEKV